MLLPKCPACLSCCLCSHGYRNRAIPISSDLPSVWNCDSLRIACGSTISCAARDVHHQQRGMAAKNSPEHTSRHRNASAQRISRFCVCRPESGAGRRNFPFAGYAQGPLSRGNRHLASRFFGRRAGLRRVYAVTRAHTNQVLNPALGSIFFSRQQSAPLAWDAPNRFLTWGWTPTHMWKIQFSYLFEYRTGYPYSIVNLEQQLVGPPNSSRFPDYKNLNLALEKKFAFRGYLWAARIEMVNAVNWQNPNVIANNVDAPNFGQLSGGERRAFTARVRFAGRK